MAIGRLIAKSLLEGSNVQIKGFGVFGNEAPSAQQHVHEKHRIWTSPRTEIVFTEDASAGFSSAPEAPGSPRTVLLADLLTSDGGLSPEDAARMSAAWAADVRQELQDAGISVLRGLGTFTLSDGATQFSQDDDFPSATEMPAIDGYSEEVAGEPATSVQEDESASSTVVPIPPVVFSSKDSSADAVRDEMREEVSDEVLNEVAPEEELNSQTEPEGAADAVSEDATGSATPVQEDQDAAEEPEATAEQVDSHTESAKAQDEDSAVTAVESSEALEEVESAEQMDAPEPFDSPEETHEAEPESTSQDTHLAPVDDEQSDQTDIEHSAEDLDDTDEFDTTEDLDDGDQEALDDSDAEDLPIVPPPARSRTPRRYERSQGGSSKAAVWVLGIVALVVIAALVFRYGISPAADEPAVAEQQGQLDPQAADSSAVAGSDSTLIAANTDLDAASNNPGDDPSQPAVTDSEGSPEATTPDDVTEAHSDDLVRGMGGYTLVVGSTMNEVTARQALDQFAPLGLPMGVLGYESDGVIRYRIAVGHYDSAVLADSARTQRANELPEGTWVLAIR